jgi:septal ring factor EnvC (AmiA/AmiB activator)
MITEKAIYWMAVGLVALVAGNHFVSQYHSRCVGTRTLAAIERLSRGPALAAILHNSSAQCAHAQTSMMWAQVRWAQAQTRFASTQTRFASLQSRFARQESMCARLEAQRAQQEAFEQLQQMRIHVIAPRVRVPDNPVRVSVDGNNL